MALVRLLATGVAIVFMTSCAKVVVVPVPNSNEKIPATGMIYALPKTVVRVQVKVDKTTTSRVPYARFAGIFAPSGKPVCEGDKCTAEQTVYSLQPGSTFTTYGEPDPDNVYLVKFSGSGAVDQTMSMTWNDAGLLSSAGASVTNRSVDIAMSSVKLLAGLGTKAAAGAAVVPPTKGQPPGCEKPSNNDAWILTILKGPTAGNRSPQLVKNYCNLTEEQRKAFNETRDAEPLKAALAAYIDNVNPLIEARLKMLSGTSMSMDPATLLPRIEAEITQQLADLFLGAKSVTTWDGTLDVREVAVGKPLDILRIDEVKGVCVVAQNAEIPPIGKPPGDLADASCGGMKVIALAFELYPTAERQLYSKVKDDTEGDRSFRYRLPAQVHASLTGTGDKHYGDAVLSIAQLGQVISLPAGRHSKTLSYELGFVESTGALKSFKLGSTGGLDSATIDSLASAGGTVLDARNARREKEDELAVLKRQKEILELKDAICTLQTKNGITCTVTPN